MTNTHYALDGTAGAQIDKAYTNAEFVLGSRITANEGSVFVFCQASGAVAGDGYVCQIDEAFQAAEITTTTSNGALGDMVGVARVALADDEYGWFQISGIGNVRVASSCAANTTLNTTAADGTLDDDATTGAENIEGIVIVSANGSTAANVEGIINNAKVGATIA